MKLEEQVVSLELAKKLKSLGVKQESLFYWQRQKQRPNWGAEKKRYGDVLFEWNGWEVERTCWRNECYDKNGVYVEEYKYWSGERAYIYERMSAFTFSELFEIYGSELVIPKDISNVANFIADLLIDKLSA